MAVASHLASHAPGGEGGGGGGGPGRRLSACAPGTGSCSVKANPSRAHLRAGVGPDSLPGTPGTPLSPQRSVPSFRSCSSGSGVAGGLRHDSGPLKRHGAAALLIDAATVAGPLPPRAASPSLEALDRLAALPSGDSVTSLRMLSPAAQAAAPPSSVAADRGLAAQQPAGEGAGGADAPAGPALERFCALLRQARTFHEGAARSAARSGVSRRACEQKSSRSAATSIRSGISCSPLAPAL